MSKSTKVEPIFYYLKLFNFTTIANKKAKAKKLPNPNRSPLWLSKLFWYFCIVFSMYKLFYIAKIKKNTRIIQKTDIMSNRVLII